jgi:hypothetical protein
MAAPTHTYKGVTITMDLQYGYDNDYAEYIHSVIDRAIEFADRRKTGPLKHRAIQCVVHVTPDGGLRYYTTWSVKDADTIRIDIRSGVGDSCSENIREHNLICIL